MTPPAGRPPLAPGARRVRVDFRLDPATVTALDEIATRDGETRTEVVERLILTEWERESR